jgi:REP element-mobilizing transposase RayT
MGKKLSNPRIYEEVKFQNKYRIPSARAEWWDYGNNAAYFITICTANRKHYFGDIRNGKMELSPIGIIADIFWHEIRNHADFVKLGEFVVMPNHIHGILIIDKPDDAGTAGAIANSNTVINAAAVNAVTNANAVTTNANAATTVETRHALSLQRQYQRKYQPQPQYQPQPPQQRLQQQLQQSKLRLKSRLQSISRSQSLSPPEPPSNQSPQTLGQKRFQNQGKNTVSSIICGYKSVVTNHVHRFGYDFQWQPRFHDHIIKNNDEYQRIAKYITSNPVNWKNDKFNA